MECCDTHIVVNGFVRKDNFHLSAYLLTGHLLSLWCVCGVMVQDFGGGGVKGWRASAFLVVGDCELGFRLLERSQPTLNIFA